MREIKFRVWDEQAKEYADTKEKVYIVGVLHNNKITLGFDSPKSEYSLGLVLEQFTGLLDKNGKEIYDGDIVAFEDKWEWYRGTFVEWWTMTYSEQKAWVEKQPMYCRSIIFDAESGYGTGLSTHYTVIGNIHDNPELLKGNK